MNIEVQSEKLEDSFINISVLGTEISLYEELLAREDKQALGALNSC